MKLTETEEAFILYLSDRYKEGSYHVSSSDIISVLSIQQGELDIIARVFLDRRDLFSMGLSSDQTSFVSFLPNPKIVGFAREIREAREKKPPRKDWLDHYITLARSHKLIAGIIFLFIILMAIIGMVNGFISITKTFLN